MRAGEQEAWFGRKAKVVDPAASREGLDKAITDMFLFL